MRTGISLIIQFFIFSCFVCSCKSSAEDVREASDWLTKSPVWHISEIYVNDALTFSEGKMKPQFGGIDFERYMETVKFEPGGNFLGYFKGDTKPMPLLWKSNEQTVTVGAMDPAAKGGEWTISPRDVFQDSFIMKTQSTAYDFPRVTKIALKFKSEK
jgi:hypothetical protein